MKIESQQYNDVMVLQLQGEFTGDTLKSLEDAVSNAFAEKVSAVILDMAKVVFIDSMALEYLVELAERFRDHTRQFKIAGLDENCQKILEVTRLLTKFDAYDELTEAVKSFV